MSAFNAKTQSKASGYLGKRLYVNYNLYSLPALRNYNGNDKKGIFAFNTRNVFSADWVTSLHQSVGISFHTTKTEFLFKRAINYTFQYKDNSGYYTTTTDDLYYNDKGEYRAQLSAYAIGLHTNLYFNQFLAPLGSYFKPEILLIKFKVNFDSNAANDKLVGGYEGYYHDIQTHPNLANKDSYSTVAIGATIGTHRIFFNRFVFDIGFQLGFVVGGKVLGDFMSMETTGGSNKNITEENYIPVSAKSRLMNQYFFNVNAGLGLLIF